MIDKPLYLMCASESFALKTANKKGDTENFREYFPPAHAPIIPLMENKAQNIEHMHFITDEKIVFLTGTSYEKRQAYELNRYAKTLEQFDKSLEINPHGAEIWKYRGSLLYILGRYEEALEAFDKSLEIDSKDENAWSFKGSTLYMLNKPEKALKAFDKALQKNPNKLEAWFNKGSILFELGKYKQSLSAVENALRINANDPNTLVLKDAILHNLDQGEK